MTLADPGELGGAIGAGAAFMGCAMAEVSLGDRIYVTPYNRSGSPVSGYYRRRAVTSSLLSSETEGSPTMPPIQTFGAHADAPPKHMLTGIHMPAMVRLNERTADGRLLRDTGFGIRDLPISFSSMTATQHGEPGQATVSGMIDYVELHEDGTVEGWGWLLANQQGRNTGIFVQSEAIRGNSVELSVRDYEVNMEDEGSMKLLIDFTDYQISATTLVANPAMEFCTVELEDPDFDFGPLDVADEMMVAAASFQMGAFNPILAGAPVGASAFSVIEADEELAMAVDDSAPPAEWFVDPEFTEGTPGRVEQADENGRIHVYGHIAAWDTPHLGVPGTSLLAPKSRTDYAYFANAETLLADGTFVATGVLTYGGKHADKGVDWREAQSHYDNSCDGWAAVAVGEDEFGIWYNGYVLPGTDPDVVARCRSLGISGDWRRAGGNLELVAALSVTARGFPLKRPSAFSSAGRQTCLIGAGAVGYVLDGGTIPEAYIPFDSEERTILRRLANFARHAEADEIRESLMADQSAELDAIAAGLA